MILIGQYDSPFVRRVGIAMTLYGLAFRQEPWSVFGDADQIRPYNPLTRVPVLVLDNGESIIDSHMILDYLDSIVPADQALFPRAEPARHRVLKVAALASGLGDKAVSLFYEQRLHDQASGVFVDRCRAQIGHAARRLDDDLTARPTAYWNGNDPGHADIAVGCVWRFNQEAHPGLIDPAVHPALAELSARLEALAPFQTIYQPFRAPA